MLTQIGANKRRGKDARMFFSLIYFFAPFSIFYISHHYVIPQAIPPAIPQTHSSFYPHRCTNEIQLLPRIFYYSWLVCLLGFWLRNAPLVAIGNPISEGIVMVSKMSFTSPCLMHKRVEKSLAILEFFGGFQDLHLDW